MKPVLKSNKLDNVCYDIRGAVLQKARQMEDDGHHIIKLNIGNLAAFGFEAPEEIQLDMIRNLPNAAGYSDSKGHLLGAQGGDALHAAEAHQGGDARRHLHRQWRLRADRDGDERPPQYRRRSAGTGGPTILYGRLP
jgi:hypothetical protein